MVRFYLHIDPDTLDDDELAKAWGQIKYVKQVIGEFKK
jgi:hypothetical protein